LNIFSIRVDSLSSSFEGWKLIKVRKTESGYKKVYFKAIKVWRRHDGLPYEKPLWLFISKDSESSEIKYSLFLRITVKLRKSHKKKGCISDSNCTKSHNKTLWISQKRNHEQEKWLLGYVRRAAAE